MSLCVCQMYLVTRSLITNVIKITFYFFQVSLPGHIFVNRFSLVAPVSRIVRRCIDHGIWGALVSAQKHMERLIRNRRVELEVPTECMDCDMFKFWLLVCGLFLAICVFGIEMLVGLLK